MSDLHIISSPSHVKLTPFAARYLPLPLSSYTTHYPRLRHTNWRIWCAHNVPPIILILNRPPSFPPPLVLLAFPVHSSGHHLCPILRFCAHLRRKDSISLAGALLFLPGINGFLSFGFKPSWYQPLSPSFGAPGQLRTSGMIFFPANGSASTCRLKIRPLGYLLSINALSPIPSVRLHSQIYLGYLLIIPNPTFPLQSTEAQSCR